MTKRFFTLLLCFALLLTMMPASARALENGDYGTIHWTFERNTGRLEVSRNDDDEGPMRDFESAEDVPWYSFRESVRFVALNSQFTSISTYAFSGMTNLTTIAIPATVTRFGANAFEGCTSPESINIPNGVIALNTKCFKDCTSLTSVKLPDSVKTVGAYASYTLAAAERHNGYTYRCKVTNKAGSVYSKTATLTVRVKPKITRQPESVTVYVGKTATFGVVANDVDSYKWQYQKPGSNAWIDVSKNGTSATYSLTTAAKHNGYKYRCQVKNDKGTVYTTTVTLTVK